MNGEERRAFVRGNRTCIFGYERKSGPPSMSGEKIPDTE